MITDDECTFSANNRVRRAWTRKEDTFLRPKKTWSGHYGFQVSSFFWSTQLNIFDFGKKTKSHDTKQASTYRSGGTV